MKKIILIILLIATYLGYSQHSDLQEKKWYFSGMTIDSNYIEPEYDPMNFPYIILEFWTGGFSFSTNQVVQDMDCEIGFSSHIDFTSTDTFEFIDHSPFSNTTNCTTYMVDFMNDYLSFYYNYITHIFTYEIMDETNGSKSLTITNSNGDVINFSDTYRNIAPENIYETWWYLHNLVINGVDNFPPINEELPDIPLSFHESDHNFVTQGCISTAVANPNFYTDVSTFFLYNLIFQFYGCSIGENDDYQNLYFDFFADNVPQGFGYSYTDNGTEKTLIITDTNGNQAIYKNWHTQDVEENKLETITVFPNPVNNHLQIESSYELKNVEIFNILCQKILRTNKNLINISNFKSGMYIVRVEFLNGQFINKKIIKK